MNVEIKVLAGKILPFTIRANKIKVKNMVLARKTFPFNFKVNHKHHLINIVASRLYKRME